MMFHAGIESFILTSELERCEIKYLELKIDKNYAINLSDTNINWQKWKIVNSAIIVMIIMY